MVCITSNPDVTGIGVRIAIYAQNLLTFIPVLMTLRDGFVSKGELKSIEEQSVTILIIAFAILISIIIQATTHGAGLSNYHASLILNLSWMNNTCTFIWFLLFVHHKTSPTAIEPTWSAWMRALTLRLRKVSEDPVSAQEEDEGAEQIEVIYWSLQVETDFSCQETRSINEQDKVVSRLNRRQRLLQSVAENLVLILGSLHLCLMSAIGLWLWSRPLSFGNSTPCESDIHMVILFRSVPLSAPALRTWSLFIYSILLVPGLNLILPFIFFLTPHILFNRWPHILDAVLLISTLPLAPIHSLFLRIFDDTHWTWARWTKDGIKAVANVLSNLWKRRTSAIYLGMLSLLLLNIFSIVDIETTIRRNATLHDGTEQEWGYGQVLSLILLVVPLRDVMYSLAFVERRDATVAQGFLARAIRTESYDKEDIKECIVKGANPDTKHGDHHDRDLKFVYILQLAASKGDLDLVKFLISRSVNINAKGGWFGTALQTAIRYGQRQIAEILINAGADVNAPVSRFFDGRLRICGPPLHEATKRGYTNIVNFLLDRGAVLDATAGYYGTALMIAAAGGISNIAQLLLMRGANVNAQGGEYGSALQAACHGESHFASGMVSLLLTHGADVNLRCGVYGTALQAAASVGKSGTIQLLLRYGARVNAQGGYYGTALQAASYWGHVDVVQILLAHHADFNISGGRHGSALGAAIMGQQDAKKDGETSRPRRCKETERILRNAGATR